MWGLEWGRRQFEASLSKAFCPICSQCNGYSCSTWDDSRRRQGNKKGWNQVQILGLFFREINFTKNFRENDFNVWVKSKLESTFIHFPPKFLAISWIIIFFKLKHCIWYLAKGICESNLFFQKIYILWKNQLVYLTSIKKKIDLNPTLPKSHVFLT